MAGNISSEKIDLLIYGPMRPILENGFPDQYVVHQRRDPRRPRTADAGRRGQAPRHGRHLSHGGREQGIAGALSEARNDRKLRRRLRSRRYRLCARAQHHRHQHARRPDRGGRRRRDGASDLDLARVRQGRPLPCAPGSGRPRIIRSASARCATARSAWSAWAGSARPSRAGWRRRAFRCLSFAQARPPACPTSTIAT